jgi:hypothetical protein
MVDHAQDVVTAASHVSKVSALAKVIMLINICFYV